MTSKFCPNCQAIRTARVSVHKRETVTPNDDKVQILTTSFHCDTCNLFINSEDVILDGVRGTKRDRRKTGELADEKSTYNGPERRSGRERRIWVDRMQEIVSKVT
jgi:C4-type Zn-finger protein